MRPHLRGLLGQHWPQRELLRWPASPWPGVTRSYAAGTSSTTAGNVVSQSPGGGTLAVPGSTVDLVIAKAPPATAKVPDVTGKTGADAASALRSAGFNVDQTTKKVTDQSKSGLVLSQSPGGGASVTG